MSTEKSEPPPPAEPELIKPNELALSEPPTIHEAELESGSSGAVLRGGEIEFALAVARRQAGQDVVVCGKDTDQNRRQAYRIEAGVGPASKPQYPHRRAGPMALPHFHQQSRQPDGHTFYETDKKKTKKKP